MTRAEFEKILEETGQLVVKEAWLAWYVERYGPLQDETQEPTEE